MKKLIFFAACCLTLFSALSLQAQSPVGTWKTIDDNTGEAKSHVEIYEENGQYFGKVTQLLLKPADTVCEKCKGDKKGKPVVGMLILENLSPNGDYWKNGSIMDPENGKEYGCSIWFEEGKSDELRVRGKHWTGLYRTQTWFRAK